MMKRQELISWLENNIGFNPSEKLSSGIPFRLRKYPEIKKEIKEITSLDTENDSELLYNLVNPEAIKVCEICGKPTQFISYSIGYKKACSRKCAFELTVRKGAQTKQEVYGDAHYNNTAKNQETKLKNHGTVSFNNTEQIKKTKKERYGSENFNNSEKYKRTCLERYGVSNGAQTQQAKQKQALTNMKKYNVEHPMQSELIKQHYIQNSLEKRGYAWPLADPFFRSKNKATGKTKNEKQIEEFLRNRGFEYQYEYVCNGKCFDFAIFKDHELSVLIETDGKYFHGLLSDPDGKNVRGERDGERFNSVPGGVKYLVADHDKTQQLLAQITEVFDINYEDWIQQIIQNLPQEFPYYSFSEERMKKDWEHLCSYTYNVNQHLAISIVKHFHKSLMEAHVGKLPSPLEAWNNKDILEQCVRNRMIYGNVLSSQAILDGFSIARFAPRVSIFNPSRARYLIDKYLEEYSEIFDPFSGFSGRLLGAASLNKTYIGQDIHEKHVNESNQIVDFLNLKNANISIKDILDSSGQYESLFTCPPYGGKEHWNTQNDLVEKSCDEWIDECLKRFSCKAYLFVVDQTEKYKENIVEKLHQHSHFGNREELVILIKKEKE